MTPDFSSRRILIFIEAASRGGLLERIPASLRTSNVEALVMGGGSPGGEGLRVTVLQTPDNQGSGIRQKLAFHYALEGGFDLVVRMAAGDAPEDLPRALEPFFADPAVDALASAPRMKGWLPGRVRVISTRALRKIPFERNANDFRFDTDLFLQLWFAGLTLNLCPAARESAGPLKETVSLLRTTLRAKLHACNLHYERKFDVGQVEFTYDLKLGFASSHTFAIDAVADGACVLDIGCGQGLVADEMAKKARRVVGLDQYVRPSMVSNVEFKAWEIETGGFPVDVSQFDQIFLLDIIEHLKQPELFMEELRSAAALKRPEIVLTTGNIAFAVTRLELLLGQFNYGTKGILDRTHTRLFTFGSLRELFEATGYEIVEVRGIPAPFPKALGDNALGRALVWLNQRLIRISKGLFSYQIFIRARALPTGPHLLAESLGRGVTSGCERPLIGPL